MKIKLKICTIIIGIIVSCSAPYAQRIGGYDQPFAYDRSSFFIIMGYLDGPSFKDFVNWANTYYHDQYGANEKIKDFGPSFCLSAGLRTRFSQYFALEVDFMTSSKKISQTFQGTQTLYQRLDLTVAAITASVPILFQFTSRQRVVPFVAAGVSVFPLMLDHTIIYTERLSKTAVAGNFSFGLDSRIGRRFWLTGRVDRTFGKAKMPVAHPNDGPDKFNIDLSTTQIQFGAMYSFQ